MFNQEKVRQFNQRWGIIDTEPYEESFRKFKTRLLNIFKDVDIRVTRGSVDLFCQIYGIPEKWHHSAYGNESWSKNIIDRLAVEDDETEFYKLLEVIFSLDFPGLVDFSSTALYTKEWFYTKVSQAIELSKVNLTVTVTDDEVIFYPKGEALLDKALVNNVLSFLNKDSNSHFVEALQFYQDRKHIKSAESLRRSLEEFLRYKMKNSSGLASNLANLKNQLKSGGTDPQVKNIILQACNYLDNYFNDNSKHQDGDIDDMENEFLIYQAGTLMRYLERAL